MRTFFAIIAGLVMVSTLSGCVELLTETVYPVAISNNPEDVEDSITDFGERGGFGGKKMTCENSKTDGKRSAGSWNPQTGGIIGGLIFDPSTGDVRKLDDVNATLTPESGSKSESQVSNSLASAGDVP